MDLNQQLYEEATHSSVLSKTLIETLLESMQYSSISFINWTIDVLRIINTRLTRGDAITDEVSKEKYNASSFQAFVKKNFSSYIFSQVYADPKHAEKVYFRLETCDGGYNLVIAPSSKEKTYEWISSLSERFSLVQMRATGIVYIKDIRNNSYSPFISEHGKYCRYEKSTGKILEV
ncbi:MAG: hypothetical protein ACOYBE_08160 [Blautia sp.]